MGKPVRILAVVVNWNGGDANLACVESLKGQGGGLEGIVFVDNGSQDGSAERVLERHPDLLSIRNADNRGYGEGNNQGIRLALERGAEAVLIVNNDVVMEEGALAALVEVLEEEPAVGIAGPRVLDGSRPGHLWAAGGRLTWRHNLTTLLGQGAPDGEAWRATRAVDYVPGCAMLVRREVFDRVGTFDADYFAYTEDVDLCLQAGRAGFGVRCVGRAAALHAHSSSTGGGYNPRRKYMMGVNSVWFLRRHAGPLQWLSFLLFDVVSLPLVWLAGLPRGRGRAVAAKALGILDGLRGRRVRPEQLEPGSSWLW